MSIIGIFAAVFGISIVYEVLLLARTREALRRDRRRRAARSRAGCGDTAAAATGAAS